MGSSGTYVLKPDDMTVLCSFVTRVMRHIHVDLTHERWYQVRYIYIYMFVFVCVCVCVCVRILVYD
jgi:hypothetical protein